MIETKMAGMMSRFLHPPTTDDLREILICSHPFCGAAVTTIYCDTEGQLFPCGCSITSSTNMLGKISKFDATGYLEVAEHFHQKGDKYYKECAICRAARICSFGCPAFSKIDEKTAKAECQGTKAFYSFLEREDRNSVQQLSTILRSRHLGQ